MALSVLLPAGAPFGPDQISALNSVFSTSTAEQRAWLSGFLAGVQTANGPQQAVPAAPPKARVPLTILFGTESGNAEALAQRARRAAGKLGFAVKMVDMAETTPAKMAEIPNLLLIASTWGEGDPPQRAVDFYEALLDDNAPRFEKTRFAVLALGDRAYAQYCEIGRRMDERLAALGATRIVDRIECDLDFEAPAGSWIDTTLDRIGKESIETVMAAEDTSVIHVDFARGGGEAWTRAQPFAAEITEHVRLTGSRSLSDTRHIELSLEGSGLLYEPGDALGIVARNDPALVDAVLKAAGLNGETALRDALRDRFDITTLTAKQITDHAALTGTTAPGAGWAMGRQVIDLLEAAPHKFSPQQLTTLLRPLPPRYYSIASSRKSAGEEAHLLVAAVRYETHGRQRMGVASIDMNERRKTGDRLEVFLRPNPHFRLPADPSRPVVMIGPGTGVAPFRGFMQEREATGAKGKNWLVFGHRNFMHDFLYQLEWQDWIKEGLLTRLDVAFSRDQPEKRYVQHALWDAREELLGWVKDGAAIYVCGDMAAMAKDVNDMLVRILSKEQLDQLRRDGRYLRDVY
ncbi:MAG: sulfite reductase subunit alpha [Acetobacteraceae bacterium]|nr:sulfite reductase subunit alpha [Acetobacteraceae bacterium]